MSRAAVNASIDDVRLQQAGQAARTARRNQPKGLLLVAGLVLLAACIYVGMALYARRAARAELSQAQSQAESAVRMAARLRAQRAAVAANPVETQPATQVLSRIQQAGVDAGLKKRVDLPPSPTTELPQGYSSKQTRWVFTAQDEDVAALLRWVERAVAAVPGLEVNAISLRPELHTWQLRVTFSRWEKVEGS